MRNLLSLLLIVTMVMSGYARSEDLTSVANQPTIKKVKRCLFTQSNKRAPLWVCDAHVEGLAVTAIGTAAKTKAGFAHMQQMALADARTHLAQKIVESSQSKVPQSEEVANLNTTERDSALITKITEESLVGTKVLKRTLGPDGTLYVLIGIDEASAQKLLGEGKGK
jgi:hypothetical protein